MEPGLPKPSLNGIPLVKVGAHEFATSPPFHDLEEF
jgi:hypothetical protein